MPIDLDGVYYRESVPRRIPSHIRVIQALLYLAVLIFTVIGSMWGVLWAVPALGTLFGAWYFMGIARICYEYHLDGMHFSVKRLSGMRSRTKQVDFLHLDLSQLVVMADEGASRLDEAEALSAAANPRRITYDVSAHDPARGCAVLYAKGTGEEAGRWLKIYIQPTPELVSYFKKLCAGKVFVNED